MNELLLIKRGPAVNKTVTATLIAALGASGCTPLIIKDANGEVADKPFSSENSGLIIPLMVIGVALAAGANSGDGCGLSSCS
jgi:hypothetical protein